MHIGSNSVLSGNRPVGNYWLRVQITVETPSASLRRRAEAAESVMRIMSGQSTGNLENWKYLEWIPQVETTQTFKVRIAQT